MNDESIKVLDEDMQGSVGLIADSNTMLSVAEDVVDACMIHIDMDAETYAAFDTVKEYINRIKVVYEEE